MNILGIVQARYNSSRLPGKVLLPFGNSTLLGYIVNRLRYSTLVNKWIVATSVEKSDDKICEFCLSNRIEFYRGSLGNVAIRFREVLEKYQPDAFVRICGDSPFIDPKLVDSVLELFLEKKPDMGTNIHPRSFPRGQSVEILNSEFFETYYYKFSSPDDFEHVTHYFYKNSTFFRIANFKNITDQSNESLVVDSKEDYELMTKIAQTLNLYNKIFSWNEALDVKNRITSTL